jgi:outer membrane protein insertion porin family
LSLFAQAAPIKSIEILGLNVVSRGTVLSYLPVEAGDEYGKKTSGQIIRALHKTGFFKDVEVSQEEMVLKIKLQENPSIKYVEIDNYSDKVIDKDTLNLTLKSMKLSQGDIFNKRQLDKLIKQLKSVYISKGYYNIKITKKIEIDPQNRVSAKLDVSEGEVARISSMRIVGMNAKNEEDLLDLFEIGESDFFIVNYFTEKDHYSKIALDAGIEAMKSLYINTGYLDFTIIKNKPKLSDDKLSIEVKIEVSEGLQYTINNIYFTGDLLNESVDELKKVFNVFKGDTFERKKILQGVNSIRNIYTNKGFAFAEVDANSSDNIETHVSDLTISLDLKEKIYINRITISGNTRTQDNVVRREINLSEGGVYSNDELEESVKKIKRLGFFSSVKMNLSKVKKFTDKINIHFDVVETKTGEMTVGVAHSNSSGTSFNFGIKENNFLGTGNTLNASFSNSVATKKADFYFSDPYFFDDGQSINYGFFFNSVDGEQLDVSSYKIDETGVNTGYGIPYDKDMRINFNLYLSNKDVVCFGDFIDLELDQCDGSDKSEVRLNTNWSSDTLNDHFYPTDGKKNSIGVDLALPIADFNYYKINASHKSYYPLKDDLTFNIKGSLGVGQGYNGKELPFFKRYYGGGSSSVRGFDFNSLGETYGTTGKAKGGELSVKSSVSIISPLKFIDNSEKMRMSAFVDAGGIYSKTSSFDAGEIRISTGLAFTWLTPLGPMGFYSAIPLVKKDGDEIKDFEFTLGSSF